MDVIAVNPQEQTTAILYFLFAVLVLVVVFVWKIYETWKSRPFLFVDGRWQILRDYAQVFVAVCIGVPLAVLNLFREIAQRSFHGGASRLKTCICGMRTKDIERHAKMREIYSPGAKHGEKKGE